MKRLKLFFACLLMAVLSIGQVWGDSYTITLKNGTSSSDSSTGIQGSTTISDFVADGASYVSAVAGSGKVYQGASGYGLKFGNSNGGGSITLTLATSVKPTSIVINASQYGASEGTGIFQGENFDMTGGGGKGHFNDYTVEYDGNTEVTTISIGAQKRGYVKSITVNYGGSTPPPSCSSEITITKADNPANGTFVIDNNGAVCIDEGNATVNVTATPSAGYHLETVTSTVGTVGDIDGNTCEITGINANTTINVTFAANPKYTVSFNVGGSSASQADITEASAGAGITLPAGPTPTCSADGWTFAGWAAAAVASETTTAPTLLSGTYHPTANVTLYAVYKRSEGAVFDGTEGGDFYIYAEISGTKYYATAFAKKPASTTDVNSAVKYTFEKIVEDAKTYFAIKSGDNYLSYGTSGTDFTFTGTDPYKWEPTAGTQGTWRMKATTGSNRSIIYRTGSTNAFAPYSFNNIDGSEYFDVEIGGGTTYYHSVPTCCTPHAITIASPIANGSVTADKASACENVEITLTPTANPAHHFVAWNVYKTGDTETTVSVTNNKFDMPDYDVTVSATFEHDPCTQLATPANIAASNEDYPYDAVALAWDAVEHADKYKVYIYTNEDVEIEHDDAVATNSYTISTTLAASTTYKVSVQAISNTPADYCESEVANTTFGTNALPTATLTLINLGEAHAESGVAHAITVPFNLPTTAAACSKAFVGWDADPDCATAPTYAKGAEFTFANTTDVTLYAVYADETPGAATLTKLGSTYTPAAGDNLVIVAVVDENTSYALYQETSGSSYVKYWAFDNNVATVAADAKKYVTLADATDGKFYLGDATNGYVYSSGSNNLSVSESQTAWAISWDGEGFKFNQGRYLSCRSDLTSPNTYLYRLAGSTPAGIYSFDVYKYALSASTYSNYATTCSNLLDNPTFSLSPIVAPVNDKYEEAINVVITNNAGEGTIYYTLNGATPTSASTEYTEAIVLNDCGTTTIKAIAISANNHSEVVSQTYTLNIPLPENSELNPYAPAGAIAVFDGHCYNNELVYVKGVVKTSSGLNSTYGNYDNIVVVAAETDAPEFTFFHMYKGAEKVQFDANDPVIAAGDTIVAYGELTKYNAIYEFKDGCYLIDRKAYTEPKQSIANDIEHPYTLAQAINFLDNAAIYDLSEEVYVKGVATTAPSEYGTFNAHDPELENVFQFYNTNLNEKTVAVNDSVIVKGIIKKVNANYRMDAGVVQAVKAYVAPVVSVTGVELNKESTSLEVGETETLVATVAPENATNKAVTWASDDETVATVDEIGVVTAVAAGTATITVTTTDGSFTDDCEVTVTAADPTKHVVTFDATIDISDQETSITKSGITITASKFNNNEEGKYYYQCYANSAMTVSSTVGNITNIELTCTASGTAKYGPGNWEFTGYSYSGANGSWAGSAETVEFGTASQQVRMTLITVTYKEDQRADAGLAWNPADDIEITVGDAFSAPALLNPNSIAANEITIASDNTELATVTNGVVELVADATGEAKITATFAGNDNYKPATVSYNITVNAAAPVVLTDYYEKVTSGAVAEGTYLIVYEAGNVAFNGGLTTLDAENNTIDVEITNDHKIGVTQATAAATFYIDPTAGSIQAANGKYIGVGGNSNGLKTSDNADTYTHNFSIDGDGNAVIAPNFEGSTMSLRYNAASNQARFRYYKDNGQQAIQLYKLANEVIKPAAGLAWDPAEDIELTVGGDFTAPALLNPNSIDAAEITIASSNTNVATVTNGEVELVADATGTTTITATFAGNASYKPATISYKIKVNPAHSIYVSPSLNVNFGSVAQGATIEDKVITVTLTNVDAATLTLAGDGASAFTISPAAALTATGDITISASSATAGTFAATLTISDDASEAASRVVNLSLTVVDPATVETAISTTSEWVPATEIADGMQVIITGVKDNVTYAMGEQKSTNRAAYVATIDGEGVLTPGEGTMAFTLVAQGDGTYAIRTSNGQYLYAAKNDANHLKTQDEVDVNAKWTLTTTSAVAEGSSNRNIMRFNGGSSKLFSCYSSGQEDIKFYVPKPVVTYVAKIGETKYESLPAAVAAAEDGQTVELLMDVAAGPGVMITSAEHKQIIIDFGNHTYCATSPVGSAGTQNQAFHFEKGCNITLQNGTITSSGNEIIMLIQNYGDLTLLNITLIGNNLPGTHRYVLSNNCGTVVIGAGTTITAKPGDVAFDVCVTNYYPEGTQVTVANGATITGIVEYDVWGTIPADNKATLTIAGGNFNITWNVEAALAEDAKDNINVGGGTFNAEVPADYCAPGWVPVPQEGGKYGVYYAGYYERGSLTPGNYATICLPYAGNISGASLFDIEYYENSTLYLLEVEGNAMVAGRPYIFLPSVEKIEVIYTDTEGAEAGSFNGLVGSLSLVAKEIKPNDGNYILWQNAYYLVNSEAYVGANRAYIHMASVPTAPTGNAPGRRRVAMAVNGEQVATGVDALNASEKPMKLMINGQLFILRGEKMYDVKGQLVK